MFKLHEIREIIKLIDESDIQEFKLDHEGSKLTLRKQSKTEYVTVAAPKEQPIYAEQAQPAVRPVVERNEQLAATSTQAVTNVKESINDKNLHQVKSPMVGTFYQSPSPDTEAYVQVGDKVNEKTVVCIIEAMKLFNEIEAEVNGEIVEILVENGQLVEYGQPLFLVKK